MTTKKILGKRILSLALTVLLVLSLVPLSVFSTFAEDLSEVAEVLPELSATIDTGESVTIKDTDNDGYYDIGNADELYAFAALVNGGNLSLYAELTEDIVVNEGVMTAQSTAARVWTPIGNSSNVYKGIFNGNNKTISGLYFNDNTVSYVGLFGYIKYAIKNTGVINSYFYGNNAVGALAGYSYGEISNCYSTSAVNGFGQYTGGVVGFNRSGYITDCYNTAVVDGGQTVGGIAGYSAGNIIKCYNTGKVIGDINVGGVTGYIANSTIADSYNTGAVSGDSSSQNLGGLSGFATDVDISNCYSTGTVSGGSNVYALLGQDYEDNSTFINCYYSDTVGKLGYNGVDAPGFVEVKTASAFASGEVAYLLGDAFGQTLGTDDYPLLGGKKVYCGYTACANTDVIYTNNADKIKSEEIIPHNYVNGICRNCGNYLPATDENGDGVYEIGNAGQLYWFEDKVNNDNVNFGSANAILTADIVVNEGVITEETSVGNYWKSIGSQYNPYTGTFDGNNHVISGLRSELANSDYIGLFGYVGKNGVVKNTGVINSYFNNRFAVGGVVGYNIGEVTNCYNDNSTVRVVTSVLGGVVGYNEGTVANCYSKGDVRGFECIGGVVGYNIGEVTNCYNTGTVDGYRYVGGVVGYIENGTITNCYYLDTCGASDGNASSKTSEEFKSGEVAYLLQGDQSEEIWGQKLGTEVAPTLGGDKIYVVKDCIGESCYSNTNEDGHHYLRNGFCGCGEFFEAAKLNEDGVYEIDNAGQLYWFAEYVNAGNTSANAILTDNIVVNEGTVTASSTNVRVWTPIGDNRNEYTGTFDGNNKTVSGLYVNDDAKSNVGLFGVIGESGMVKNTGVINSYFKGDRCVGGVSGYNFGTITNCFSTAQIIAFDFVGGVVGCSYGTVAECYNAGTVNGYEYVSGVVGYNCYSGTISNCYNTGKVRGTTEVGGIAGANDGIITNCYYLENSYSSDSGPDYAPEAEVKTYEQFASGEVAYLLGDAFGQELGTDDYPLLGGKKVYGGYTGCADTDMIYTNNADIIMSEEIIPHDFVNGFCTVCDAFEPATDENEDGVYEIGNAGQLYWFAEYVNAGNTSANAILTADIVVNEGTMSAESTDARPWTPIGNYNNQYAGTFDGNDYTISGLYFNNTDTDDVGLFGYTGENGTVKNTGVINSYFNGYSWVGSVVGSNYGKITNCYNTGDVSGNNYVGGLVGYNPIGTIIDCYNTGDVSGTGDIGGVVGYSYGTIANCYNTGDVSGDYGIGGVVGENYNGTITNCYYLDTTCTGGIDEEDVQGSAEAKTAEQFANGEVAYLLQGEQSEEIWGQKIGTDELPTLGGDKVYYGYTSCADDVAEYTNNSNASAEKPDHNYVNGFCTDCDIFEPATLNEDGVYEIGNAGQLYWFADKVNNDNANFGSANAILTADIVVNEGEMTAGTEGARVWTTISNFNNRYAGTFDGNNKTISGLYFNDSNVDYIGLFGYVGKEGEVKNIGVINSYFNGNSCVGGVAGGSFGTITNCYNTGVVSGSRYVGGIVGINTTSGGTINCYNSGNVSGSFYIGGIVGNNTASPITNCYNTGTVNGYDSVGGVAGYGYSGKIINCYNTGRVEGSKYVAGVVGYDDDSKIDNCYNTGYISGDVCVGGVGAYIYNSIITNCYYLDTACNGGIGRQEFDDGEYVEVSAEAKTAEQFASGEVAYLLQGEQEELVWGQKIGTDTAPTLGGDKVYYGYASCAYDSEMVYSNTDVSDVRPAHKEFRAEFTWDKPYDGECYVSVEFYCADCGDYVDYDSDYATLKETVEAEDCMHPGSELYEVIFEYEGVTYTDTKSFVLRSDNHTGELVNGFCSECGGFEAAKLNDNGTPDDEWDDYYEISNAGQLYWYAQKLNEENTEIHAKLVNDITVPEDAPNWTPINCTTAYFDGNFKTISGLKCVDKEAEYVGLFGLEGWWYDISNLHITDSYFEGKDCVGAVVACLNNGGYVKNCYVTNTTVKSDSSSVGALVGDLGSGNIVNCYADTDTLAGYYNSSYAEIKNSYYLADTDDGEGGKTAEQFESGEVAYLLQSGVEGEDIYDDDYNYIETIIPEIWGQKIGTDEFPTLGGDKVYQVENCVGGLAYSNANENGQHNFVNGFCTLCGGFEPATLNEDGVYEIGNAGQLYWFAELVNSGNTSANAILTADIVVNEGTVTESSTDARVWTPIGNNSNRYTGAFDGNNKTVSGLYFNNTDTKYVGLFGYIGENSTVKNTGVINSYFNGLWFVGGVVGANYGTITNCYNTGDVSGVYFTGGIVGQNCGTITRSYNTGIIEGFEFIGGVAGYNDGGTITNCYNIGEVSGSYEVGGVVGKNSEGLISNCYNTGEVSGANDYIGGVAGANQTGTITNCYYLDTAYAGGIGMNDTTKAEDIEGSAEAKTAEAFASGEVAYLLQGEQEELVWGQKIGTDELPTLGGDKVYYGYASCADDVAEYTNNSNASAEKPDHNFVNGFCTVCGGYEPATLNEDGVYEIGNAGQLYWFADKVNNDNANFGSANAILTADIVVNEGVMTAESEGARAWTPIGNFNSKYSGSFDGNNKTVSGLYLNESSKWYVGLFGFVYNGTVKNTGVINSYFCGSNDVGAIVGACNSGEIINCYNESIVVGDSYTGGVAGYNEDSTMTDCYNSGNVSGNHRIAGVVGFNQRSIISNTYNTGVIGTGECVGGIVGESDGGAIESCYNAGEIIGRDTYRVGGIIGQNRDGSVDNCYNIGTVDGTDSMFVGGIAGNNIGGTITNCYYLNTACEGGIDGSDLKGSAEAKTAEQFKSGEVAYLLGDAFGQKIGTDELPTIGGDKVYYGYLSCADDATAEYTNNSNVLAEKPDHNYVNGFCTVCGGYEPATLNEDGVYEIGNAGQLYWFADKVNNDNANFGSANAILTADIVVNEGVMTAESEGARAWTPIGNDSNSYTGTFDGNNKTVSGLYFNNSDTDDVGLFGYIGRNSTVKNTGVINSYFYGCNYVGGVVGHNYYGTITNCYNSGSVSGTDYVGGLVGSNARGTIDNSYNAGSVSGTDRVGGLVGFNTSGATIGNCYNEGSVSGTDLVGGVVGYNNGTIANCYNTGEVSGSNEVGGVVGYNNVTITNCYYLDTTCTGGIYGEDVQGSAEAKTVEQFKGGEVAYLLQGEQEELVWGQKIGTDEFPVLGGDKVYAVKDSQGNITGYSNTNESDVTATDKLAGYSISLGDKIAVNYYMSLTNKTLNDANAKMVFTVPDTGSTYTLEIPVKDAVKSGDYYVFTCEVAAKEMTSVIEAKLVTSESELVLEDYSVQKYAEYILKIAQESSSGAGGIVGGGISNTATSEQIAYIKAAPLVKAMLNYGAEAQLYFDYNTDNLANDTEYMTAEEKITELYGFAGAPYTITGEEAGVTYYGTALSLETELMFKHYFIIDESVDTQSLEITCDYPVTLKKNGSFYELAISDIPAHKMGENSMVVTIGGMTLDYTIYSYGALVQNSGNEEIWTVVSALAKFAGEATVYALK